VEVPDTRPALTRKKFEKELAKQQLELVKMLDWIRSSGHKLVVLFEGRDAAGKGGTIKRIAEPLNPRSCRVVALPAPTERERTQWYFQRYAAHLPSAGEIVLFDRSWYNRAGVERVMGFCTDAEYWEFLRAVPEFERMLQRSGIQLVKYWFSVSDREQERRFQARIDDPAKQWKLSPMDLYSRSRWVDYSKAKDIMIEHTSTADSQWWEVDSDDKRRARLNCIHHLLSLVPYTDVAREVVVLPARQEDHGYRRPPIESLNWIPTVY
jgi:polyphosphate kinase 2